MNKKKIFVKRQYVQIVCTHSKHCLKLKKNGRVVSKVYCRLNVKYSTFRH